MKSRWWKDLVAAIVERLFKTLTHPTAAITRFTLTFIDVWQAYVAVYFYGWYMSSATNFVVIYAYTLAILSIVTLFSPIYWLTIVVLFVNIAQFTYLTIQALAFYPPTASTGLYIFAVLMSLAAFWRSLLYAIEKRHGDQ